uniref:ribonuclease H n=1 Tax=Anolis carolinensis TaxID=28377 RepID=A0A803TJP4_ANOCA
MYGWFDAECRAAKRELANKIRESRQKPSSKNIENVTKCRAKYKNLLKNKKDEHAKSKWQELEQALTERKEDKFWELVTRGIQGVRYTSEASITASTWIKHFSSIFCPKTSTSEVAGLDNVNDFSTLPEWDAVSSGEVKSLIASLKPKKAPGEDMLPPELFKENPEWWSPFLASLFTSINSSGQMPGGWKMSIIVPIYKKGGRNDPQNYRPISLLNITSKLYAQHLLQKLTEWLQERQIVHEEQAGFRNGYSTIDQCFTLNHIIRKYTKQNNSHVFAAFIDLSAAFDSINRNRLWGKLQNSDIDRRLLRLIQELYTNTEMRVRVGRNGSLTEAFSTTSGVKQGCLLAPTLFNIYVNDLVPCLAKIDSPSPTIRNRNIFVLMYADDVVLLSLSRLGLKNLLKAFSKYCQEEYLSINYSKTKVMVFGRHCPRYKWTLDQHDIEQTHLFKYLGIVFSESLSWKHHRDAVKLKAEKTIGALMKFFYTQGGQLIEPAQKIFSNQVLAQILYGAEIWGLDTNICKTQEILQNKFLRKLYSLPSGTPAALLCTESGWPTVKAKVDFAQLRYLKRIATLHNDRLPALCFEEMRIWQHKKFGLENLLLNYNLPELNSALNMNKRQLRDWLFWIDSRRTLQSTRNSKFSPWFPFLKTEHFRARYLIKLKPPSLRIAFTELRFQVMPTAVLDGRYHNVPWENRLCICGQSQVEDIVHYMLVCPLYSAPRERHLEPLLTHGKGNCLAETMHFLLSDTNNYVTHKVALFALSAKKIRKIELDKIAINCRGDSKD